MFIPIASFRRPAALALGLGALLALGGSRAPAQAPASANATLYSHGDPTADEQYLLEQLNRARANPAAEGPRMAALLRTPGFAPTVAFYNLNPDAVAAQIAAFPPAAPLAFNAALIAAARAHSADLAPHDGTGPGNPSNDHQGYDGSLPYGRTAAAGYSGSFGGENFDPGSDTLDANHAGYLVDWGNPGLPHLKQSLRNDVLREVGMGIAVKPASLNSPFPLVETEDFGWAGDKVSNPGPSLVDAPALLTGVAYNDANGNGQYDPGEGAAGITVTMDGGAYYAVTGASGGYALPLVNADGSFHDGAVTVRMSGGALGGDRSASLTVAGVNAGPDYRGFDTWRPNLKWDAVVNQSSGGGPGPTPPADSPVLLSLSGGGMVSRSAGGKAVVTVQRTATDLSQPLTVAYKTKGAAVAGVDYKPLPGSVTIPAGADHAAFKVKALKSGAAGGSATLTIKIAKAPGTAAQAGQGKISVAITP